jgi:crotonobetainyl-CoA:carnitine CoA-transferase CaiB-like acyl-CoA transferase
VTDIHGETVGDANLPLGGLLVADLSVTLPGPYCSHVLRSLGAEVVQLEPPAGDVQRTFIPGSYASLGRGKRSIAVDLKTDAGSTLALEVAREADVVIEGWRPGVAERLGISYSAVSAANPRVVYCSISGYGQTGPLASRAGHDLNYLAVAGALRVAAHDGIPLADFAGATAAAIRILASVRHAAQTGHGAYIDVSLTGSLMDWMDAYDVRAGCQVENDVHLLPHYGLFTTADGRDVTFGVAMEQPMWASLITALGQPSWAELEIGERIERRSELGAFIAERVGGLTSAELAELLGQIDTCWAFSRCDPSEPSLVTGRLPTVEDPAPELDGDRAWFTGGR